MKSSNKHTTIARLIILLPVILLGSDLISIWFLWSIHLHIVIDVYKRQEEGIAYKKPEKYAPIHMPRNTGAGVIIAEIGRASCRERV